MIKELEALEKRVSALERATRRVSKVAAIRVMNIECQKSVDTILGIVSKEYGASPVYLLSRSRQAQICRVRGEAMYIAHLLLNDRWGLADIGKALGGRDHGTIWNGVRSMRGILETEPKTRARVEALTAKCREALQ